MSLFTTQLIPNGNNIYLFHPTFCWFQCGNCESERAEARLAALQHLCEFTNSKCLHKTCEHQGLKSSCSRTLYSGHACFKQQIKQNMSYCWCSVLCTSEIDVFAIFKVMRLQILFKRHLQISVLNAWLQRNHFIYHYWCLRIQV